MAGKILFCRPIVFGLPSLKYGPFSTLMRGCGSNICSEHSLRTSFVFEALSKSSLSELYDAVGSFEGELDPHTGVQLMQKALALKAANDPRVRGRISREFVNRISTAVLAKLESLSADDLTTLVLGVCDNTKCLDEFLMYKIAREVVRRITEFSTKQLVDIARSYCKQELEDEELLLAISNRIVSAAKTVTVSQLISVLRAFSLIHLREESLISKTIDSVLSSKKLWEKDAITLLTSMADLDIYHEELLNRLWQIFLNRKQQLSHDEEYNLVFVYILFSPAGCCESVQSIVGRATAQHRIRKRLQLLSDCIHHGMVPDGQEIKHLPSPSRISLRPRMKKTSSHFFESESPWSVSSGLHLEVASSLQSMGLSVSLEVPASCFTIDTVLYS